MVANSILTNPTLFCGCEKTNIDCIQNWIDICFNSTLSDYEFSEVSSMTNTIPEKPPYLTFQCFHHHLVFMLEKILPKYKRRIFNSLQKFADVLEFLYEEFEIKPKLFDIETFTKQRSLPIWSSGTADEVLIDEYDYEANSGSLFTSKIKATKQSDEEYDLGNMFVEI